MSAATRPTPVQHGDAAHVVAPSGPVPAQRLDKGLKVLRRALGLRFVLANNLLEQEGYFAGKDGVRLGALADALASAETQLILCARGGYGATRLLSGLDPEPLRRRPRLLVGFSDITALLCWAWTRAGVPGIHGPVITQIADLMPEDLDRLVDMLRGDDPGPLCIEEGTIVHGGCVEGPLIAGNLELLRSLVGTRFMPSLEGCILALEEVGERPYRIDRALTQLMGSGALRGLRGVAVGQLLHCEEPEHGQPDSPTAHEVVVERLSTLGLPVVTGFEFGHAASRHAALPFGTRVRLDANTGSLTMLEAVTQA